MRRIGLISLLLVTVLIGVAGAEVVTGGDARVSFHGSITPRNLPRGKSVPVSLHMEGKVQPIGEFHPPKLLRLTIAINRHGVISTRGLPVCQANRLKGRTTEQALATCRDALVGTGHFSAHVDIPDQSPFPAEGQMLAFNTVVNGHPAMVGHVFGTDPAPISQVLPFSLTRRADGQFGATFSVKMPEVGADWGYVTGFDMTFHRLYEYKGEQRSFLTASCPAPKGVPRAPFKAAKGTFYLAEGQPRVRVLSGSCQVR